jgi:hypothetical protein
LPNDLTPADARRRFRSYLTRLRNDFKTRIHALKKTHSEQDRLFQYYAEEVAKAGVMELHARLDLARKCIEQLIDRGWDPNDGERGSAFFSVFSIDDNQVDPLEDVADIVSWAYNDIGGNGRDVRAEYAARFAEERSYGMEQRIQDLRFYAPRRQEGGNVFNGPVGAAMFGYDSTANVTQVPQQPAGNAYSAVAVPAARATPLDGVTIVVTDAAGAPLENAQLAAISRATEAAAPMMPRTDQHGRASLPLPEGHDYVLLVAHEQYPGVIQRFTTSHGTTQNVSLTSRDKIGSHLISSVGYLPGLPQNRLNPIFESEARRWLYVDHLTAAGFAGQPYHIDLNRPLRLSDFAGERAIVRFLYLLGQTSLINFQLCPAPPMRGIVELADDVVRTLPKAVSYRQQVRDFVHGIRVAIKELYGTENYECHFDIRPIDIQRITALLDRLKQLGKREDIIGGESDWQTVNRLKMLLDDIEHAADQIDGGIRPL